MIHMVVGFPLSFLAFLGGFSCFSFGKRIVGTFSQQLSAPLAPENDGSFYMPWEDFATIYDTITICPVLWRLPNFFLNKKDTHRCAASRIKTSQVCGNVAMFYMEIIPYCRILKNYRLQSSRKAIKVLTSWRKGGYRGIDSPWHGGELICSNSGRKQNSQTEPPLGERNQSTLGTKKLALRKTIVKNKSFFAFSKFEIIQLMVYFTLQWGFVSRLVFSPDFGHHHGLCVSPFESAAAIPECLNTQAGSPFVQDEETRLLLRMSQARAFPSPFLPRSKKNMYNQILYILQNVFSSWTYSYQDGSTVSQHVFFVNKATFINLVMGFFNKILLPVMKTTQPNYFLPVMNR